MKMRRVIQFVILGIFLYLFFHTRYEGSNQLGYPVAVFLQTDPLLAIGSAISSHTLPTGFIYAVLLLILTIILGRFFCGWVCPMGTIHDLISWFLPKKKKSLALSAASVKKFSYWRYVILMILIVPTFLGANWLGLLDPLSLLIRSLAIGVIGPLEYLLRGLLILVEASSIGIGYKISDFAQNYLLNIKQPLFSQTLLIGSIFVLLLASNALYPRFWCLTLCPLGAFLGLFSRFSLLRRKVTEACNGCRVCQRACHGLAIARGYEDEQEDPSKDKETKPFEIFSKWAPDSCISCLECQRLCNFEALSFHFTLTGSKASGTSAAMDYNASRRQFIVGGLGGLSILFAFRSSVGSKILPPNLLRPPGSLPEEEFLAHCVRCAECMRVCLTGGLQPTLTEAGLEALWTPKLVPLIGYCEYSCNLCGQVCPTGAIKNLTLAEKKKYKIGLAYIDRNRCLPYVADRDCIVCEEHCPTPKKAIWFKEEWITDANGIKHLRKLPQVNYELCIGCGICEAVCPVKDRGAIITTRFGESRAPQQLL